MYQNAESSDRFITVSEVEQFSKHVFYRYHKCLRCTTTHDVNGSPVNPDGQTQLGMWSTTRHSALAPQEPGQGSRHFWLMQARLLAHSLLITHSGRQLGGAPTYPGKQVHDGLPLPNTWH
ncbi:hypothetical protein C0J52_11059 [Blattella germanica]|nr:hypothetical protein C0J52_11059 [Blattella germanica]